MSGQEQVTNFASIVSLGQQVAQCEEISERLAHLFAFDQQMRAVKPVFHKPMAGFLQPCAFALGDFVLVMRENQVLAAHVDVETGSKYLGAHGAALDVPTGSALAPRAGPKDIAILGHSGFPEGKVRNRLLGILVIAHSLTRAKLLKIEIQQLAVAAASGSVLCDAEVNRPVRRGIGDSARHEFFDQGNNLLNEGRRMRRLMRQQASKRLKILKKRLFKAAGIFSQGRLVVAHSFDDLILDIGDIHHMPDGPSFELDVSARQVGEDKCAEVADMGKIMHGWTAAIKSDAFARRIQRDEFLHRPRQRIEKLQRHNLKADRCRRRKTEIKPISTHPFQAWTSTAWPVVAPNCPLVMDK